MPNSGLLVTTAPPSPIRSQILAGIEAEAAEIADRSGASALVFCTMSLRRVLDHDEPVAASDSMIGSMSAISPCKCTGKIAFVRGVIAASIKAGFIVQETGIDVDEDRLGAAIKNRCGRGDERHRYCDHLIARTNAGREQRKMQRRGSAVDRAAMIDVAIGCKTILKGRDVGSQNELGAVDDPRNRGINLWLDLVILSF